MTGDEQLTVDLAHRLYQQAVMGNTILYPAVLEGKERLRFFVTDEQSTARSACSPNT
ncbi:hypothetical protein [Lentzea jiangxiensis]|nr:hypothetical protein [Lentzea jiangxiensis]